MTDHPITILDLRDSPWVDGPGRTILQTASLADPVQCRILIGAFCGDSHGDHAYLNEARTRQLDTFVIRERKTLDFNIVKQITGIIRENRVDMVHCHDFRSQMYGLISARLVGVPLITTCHGWIANNFKGRVYTVVDKFLLRFADHIITVSKTMRRQLLKLGFSDAKISVIQNALIIDNYIPDVQDNRFRRELMVGDKTAILLNIGRLSPEKGQDIFLQAAKKLLDMGQDLIFVLVGIGPEECRLRQMAQDFGIEDRVVFAGYRDDMASIYNSADLVVQSSYTEGMPNVILEALLMSVPVVATDVGGTTEVVQEDFSGTVIPPHDLNALVYGIDDFLNDRSRYRKMAEQGRRYIDENFNHLARVEKTEKVYNKLFTEKR